MNEVCFCGWAGAIEDRRYVMTDDFREGLACPSCGRVDFIDYLPALSRQETLATARARTAARRDGVAHLRPFSKQAAA